MAWPELGITWRSSPVVAIDPDDGRRLAFSYSIGVKSSGEWLARSTTVQYNYLEIEEREDVSEGAVPALKGSLGSYATVNNLALAAVTIVAGAVVAAVYFTRGEVLKALPSLAY
jgi:hypothetical protein